MAEDPGTSSGLLESRIAFETLISDTSASLFAVAAEETGRVVEAALERVRLFFGADRCALLKVDLAREAVNVWQASYAEGVSPVAQDVNLAELFPWAWKRLVEERLPIRVSTLADLPPEAAPDLPAWVQMGVRSALTLPIENGAVVRSMIVIQSLHRERAWPDILVTRLKVLGELLTSAMEREELFVELRRREARLTSGAELAGLAHYEMDYGRGAAYADDRFHDLCGVPAEQRRGLQPLHFWMEHLDPMDRAGVLDQRERMHDGRLEGISTEYRYLHPARGQIWIHHLARVVRRDANGRALLTTGVFRDVTERRRAEQEVSDLSRRLLRAHEDERARLGRELHDDVTQRLAVLAIDVGRAELAAPDGAQAAAMRMVREELVRLSEDVHSLSYQLHPAVLDELGLAEALRTAGERFGRRCGVALSMELDPTPTRIEREVGLCLFRVAQEALSNVANHAAARSASVRLRQLEGGLYLAIRDDGVGFVPASRGTRRGLGLESMRERMRLVNGTLDIESAPGQGTAVVAWVAVGGGAP